MEAVLALYGLALAVPCEGHPAGEQVVNDLLRIVKVHHVARRHLDNAELHPHHLRVLDRGDHLVIALLKRAFARVFHGFFAPFSQFCVAESRPLCTGGCA